MALTERLALIVTGDTSQAARAVGELGTSADKSLSTTSQRMQQVGGTLTRTLTPAMAGLGAVSYATFNEFDAGEDALRAAGATGDEFVDSMNKVGSRVPASLGEVGTVMGELYQRTQLTGEPLEKLTEQVLELGELGQTVNVEQLTASLTKSGVEAEDMTDALDDMYRVTQITGTSVDRLSQLQEQFGASLDLAGFSLEDQVLLLGQLEASGVNTSQVMAGMSKALREMAESGQDPAVALADLFEQMQNAGSEAEAVAIASDTFGRSAVEVAAAVRAGRIDLEDLRAEFEANTDSIGAASDESRDLVDKFEMLKNKAVALAGPFSEYGMIIGGIGAGLGPVVSGMGSLFERMSQSETMTRQLGSSTLSLNSALGGLAAGVGGAAAAWAAYTMMMNNARDSGDSAAASWQETIMSAATSTDDFRTSLERLGEETVGMAEDVAGSVSPLDADYRAALNAAIDANTEFIQQGDDMLSYAERISTLFGESEDAALGWLIEQRELGNTFETSSQAMAAYQDMLTETAGRTLEQQQATEEATQALDEWQSALRAQFDPLFALNQALADQRKAQDEANGAAWLYGPASQAAAEANLALTEANLTATTAAAQLKDAIDSGTVSLAESSATLDGWVAAGLMTEEQAASVRWQLGLVAGEADRLDGRSLSMTVTANTAQAELALANLRGFAMGIFGGLSDAFGGMFGASMSGTVPGRSAPQGRSAPRGRSRDEVVLNVDGHPVTGVVSRRQRMVAKERV